VDLNIFERLDAQNNDWPGERCFNLMQIFTLSLLMSELSSARTGRARILRNLLPPMVFDFLAKLSGTRISVNGNYSSWQEAATRSRGYDTRDILERVRQATRVVVTDNTKFERDGVVFAQKHYPFALIAVLLDVAQRNNGKLSVMDFGGSLGSSYYQCRDFLTSLRDVRWSVVEQAHFVDCGNAEFQNETLRFYHSIEDCYRAESPKVVLFSSVLQYLENVEEVLQDVARRKPDTVMIDRTPIIEDYSRIAVQRVPSRIGKASYPVRLFAREDLTKHFTDGYRVLSTFVGPDPPIFHRSKVVTFEGVILQKLQ
jgi:putative methyltransferase (TIGR04325 family)